MMGQITILNDTNSPINSCISAGVNYSWVNGLSPKEYYIHDGASGVYSLNTKFWLGEGSEYTNSGVEIGLWVGGVVLGIAGLLLLPVPPLSELVLTAAGGVIGSTGLAAAAAGGVIGSTGLVVSAISIAGSEFSNEPSTWTNIHALQDRKFIATGKIDIARGESGTVIYKNSPLIILRELSDDLYRKKIESEDFKKHNDDMSRGLSADYLTKEDLIMADILDTSRLRITPSLGGDCCLEVEADNTTEGALIQLWPRESNELKSTWFIKSEEKAENEYDVFLIYNPELKRYASVTEQGSVVSAKRTSTSEFRMVKSGDKYAFFDCHGRLMHSEDGNFGKSTKLKVSLRGAEGNPEAALWKLNTV